jgi:6-pyruvoyltetrahydropterin/6-carboxytetrahydropterin synthase
MQGGHHVAQKLSSSSLPPKSETVTCFPLSAAMLNAGALSPTLTMVSCSENCFLRMIISKKVEFSASHICRSAQLSDEENQRIYGAAANPLGHGHNYEVEVAIEGEPDPLTGMILDLKRLKDILEEKVLDIYDHRLLNREVEPFDRIVPTVENMAIDIWNRLEQAVNSSARARLYSVRVHETNDLFVEYRGGK